MAGPELNEFRRGLRDVVREFFAREVAPVSAEIDRREDPADCMPWELIRAGSKLGLRTLALSEEWGGVNADSFTRCVLREEMCRVEAGLAKRFTSCWRSSLLLYRLGTPAQREKFLRPFVEDPTYCVATAFTEPGAGSDNQLPSEDPKRGVLLEELGRRKTPFWELPVTPPKK